MIHVLVHDRDARIAELLLQVLRGTGSFEQVTIGTDWQKTRAALDEHGRMVLVLGPSTDASDLEHVVEIAGRHDGVAIIHVADEVDVDTLRNSMRCGIREVIPAHATESELPPAVDRARSLVEAAPPPLPTRSRSAGNNAGDAGGKVVAIVGAKGGAGKTTLATNLAVLVAAAGPETALVDASIRFGDCAAFLRVKPERTLLDLAGISGVIDGSALESVLMRHPSGLRILCGANDPLRASKVDAALLSRVVKGLRDRFEWTFVDTGPAFDESDQAVLAEADFAYMVVGLDLPSVKNARILLSTCEQLGIGTGKVRVVLNRADSSVGFPREEVRKALGRRPAIELPSDIAIPRSVNAGTPVALDSPKAKVSKRLRSAVDELISTGAPERAVPGRPLLKRALSRAAES